MLDHILYQEEKFHLHESLSGPVDKEWLKRHQIKGAPSQHLPSDHFPLAAKFLMNPDAVPMEDLLEETSQCEEILNAVNSPEMLEENLL